MQVSTSRQLSPKHKGELTWVVGPPHARAMVLGVTSKFKTFQTAVGVEVCNAWSHVQRQLIVYMTHGHCRIICIAWKNLHTTHQSDKYSFQG